MLKRGTSHIEFVLAFVLFIGFLIFALMFFNPLDNARVLGSSLEYAFDEVSESLTSELNVFSVSLKNVDPALNLIRIPVSNEEDFNVRVLDANNSELTSRYDFASGHVIVDRENNNFIYVLFSEDFNVGGASGGAVVDTHEISSSDNRKVISEKKAVLLKGSYENNYEVLKNQMNLPGRIDFSFQLTFNDGSSIIGQKNIPGGLEVESRRERVETIRENGGIEFADLIVKVW